MTRRKWTLQSAKEAFAENGKMLLATEYVNPRTKMPYICLKHKDEGVQYMTLDKCLRGQGCHICKVEKISSKRRTNTSEIQAKCKDMGLIYVRHYVENNKTKVVYICPIHKDKGERIVEWSSLNHGHGCDYCARKQRSEKLRVSEEVVKEKCKELGLTYIRQYIKRDEHHNQTIVVFICPKHKDYGEQSVPWQNMKNGKGCICCSRGMFSINSRTPFIHIKAMFNMLGLELLSTEEEYYEANIQDVKLKYRCPKHPNVIQYKSVKSLAQGCGCALCNTSRGEEKVGDILDKLKFSYNRQHTFPDCKNKRVLPFDFYIPCVKVAIEYDGEQHYQPITFGGSIDEAQHNFEQTQHRDAIKTQYCIDNGIKLIRIPYWEKDNIEEILKKELNIY